MLNNKNKATVNGYKIYIIGAGISGLIAAKVLEEKGFSPIILEETNTVGGRLKTDSHEGYQLDRGFQVLLTAYPSVKKHLNLRALDLQLFKPGAVIFKNRKQLTLGDPTRDLSLLFPTLFSGLGKLSDMIKILKLNQNLKQKTVKEIFDTEEKSTSSYLKDLGFSFHIINDFFKPFFSGIFLEPNLSTSSRMFEFIYKMFGKGYAALPKGGIAEIPKQLANNLSNASIRFNTKVKAIRDGEIELHTGETIQSDYSIVATNTTNLVNKEKEQSIKWKSCETLYFETIERTIKKPLIGLIPDNETLINNIFFHTSLKMALRSKKELLSVTIVKEYNLSEEELISTIQKELKEYCNIHSSRFLKRYKITMALPDLKNVQYKPSVLGAQLEPSIFLAGDASLNGSLNAAILSGENAAKGVLNSINNRTVN